MRLFASRSSRLAALVLLAQPGWSPTLPAAEQRVADPRDLPEFPPVTARDALSLMPGGLEEGLSNQDLADLADFIMADSRQDQTP